METSVMLERLRALFVADDPDVRTQGVELLRSLDDPSLFDAMLEGTAHATVPLDDGRGQADVLVPGPYFHAVRLDHRKALRTMCWQVLAVAPAQSAFASLRDRVRVLQLSDPDVGGPVDLEQLSLPAGLRALHIRTSHPVTGLGALRQLAQLEALTLGGCRLPEGMDAIADMPGLRALTVQWVTVGAANRELTLPDLETLTIAGLAPTPFAWMRLPSLRTLSLGNFPDADLRALGHMTSLRALDLSPNLSECSLDGIESLTALERLRFLGGGLKTLDPLAPLRELRALDLSWLPRESDLSALTTLPALRELRCASVTPALAEALRTRSLEAFACESLDPEVDLSFLGGSAALASPILIPNAPGLRTLAGLHPDAKVPSLDVRSSPELEAIGALPGALRELHLHWAPKLSDLGGIHHAQSLEALTVHRARSLEALAPLASLAHLKRLTVSDAPSLCDLSAFASLPALEEVSLKSCEKVTDLTALARCPSLKGVLLAGTAVDRKRAPRELLDRCSWDQKLTMERLLERQVAAPQAPAHEAPRAPRVVVAAEHRDKLGALAQTLAAASMADVSGRVRAFMADATPAFWGAALSQWIAHPPSDKKPFGEIAVRAGLSAAARSRAVTMACLALLRHAPDGVPEKGALRDQIEWIDLPPEADADELPPLPKLAGLRVGWFRPRNLKVLASPSSLRALHLRFEGTLKPPSLDALSALESLTVEGELDALPTGLAGRALLRQLSLHAHVDKPALDLKGCAGLESLSLTGLHQKALPAWTELPSLKHLSLSAIRQLEFDGLGVLSALESLTLHEIARLRDLSALAKLTRLKRVVIQRCPFVEDLSPLVGLPALESVTLTYATPRPIPTTPGLEGKLNVR